MALIITILAVITVLGFLFIGIGFFTDEIAPSLIGLFLIIIAAIGIFCIKINNDKNPKPTALDVYRGKTTLQITYKDSIPIDSIVVFK